MKAIFKTALLATTSVCCLAATAAALTSQQTAVVNHFKAGNEKTAKDVLWTAPGVFKVGVINNGSNRDGYAGYVCEIMYENGLKGQHIWVQIIDIQKLVKTGKFEKIGDQRCL